MFSSTPYGLFETPIITTAGMITGMGIDGSFVMRSNPVINMNDFFRPHTYQETNPYKGRSICDVVNEAEREYKRTYEHNKSVSKEIQLNELKSQNAMREENEKKLAAERAMRDAAEKALAEEREKKLVEERTKREAAEKALAEKLAEEKKAHTLTAKSLSEYDKLMRKLAMKNLSLSSGTSTVSSNKSSKISSIKSSATSTVSRATSLSKMSSIESVISDVDDLYNVDDDDTEITFSDSASNSGTNSDSESENDSDDESDASTIISSKQKTIDPNEKSRFSNCTRCAKCFNGVSSVGCIIVSITADDHLIILGKSVTENAFCDYSHKLKSNGKRSELPSERAEKIFKKMTDIDYDIDQNQFIDIPIKDNLHVHRVFIINYNEFKTAFTINITTEYNEIGIFSMNTILDNNGLFENKQIYDNNNALRNINKRMKKIIDLYYKLYC
jgi:hypothetical protein